MSARLALGLSVIGSTLVWTACATHGTGVFPFELAWMRGGELHLEKPNEDRRDPPLLVDPPWPRYLEWAPDGSSLLFACHDAGWNVWSLDLASGTRRRLTTPGDNRVPSWSPDGRQIAWMRGGDGLWVMDYDGSNPRRLTPRGHRDSKATWSPDGRRLVFTEFTEEGVEEVWLVDKDGAEARCLRRFAGSPSFSPEGLAIACHGYHGDRHAILILDPDSDDSAPDARFAPSDGRGAASVVVVEDEARLEGPAWSPDGETIAFVRAREESCEVRVMPTRRDLPSPARAVHAYTGRGDAPVWTADGEWLIVTTRARVEAVRVRDGRSLVIGGDGCAVAAPRPRG